MFINFLNNSTQYTSTQFFSHDTTLPVNQKAAQRNYGRTSGCPLLSNIGNISIKKEEKLSWQPSYYQHVLKHLIYFAYVYESILQISASNTHIARSGRKWGSKILFGKLQIRSSILIIRTRLQQREDGYISGLYTKKIKISTKYQYIMSTDCSSQKKWIALTGSDSVLRFKRALTQYQVTILSQTYCSNICQSGQTVGTPQEWMTSK